MSDLALVDIVLATYNGERFLSEQLESILAQSYQSWRILVRDDGSSDGTIKVLREYASRLGARFVLVQDNCGRLGAAGNFGRLLELSSAPYVALCDQDDVWLPEKLTRLVGVLQDAEQRWGKETPLLVHSDLAVVDAQGRVLARSFWRYQNLNVQAGGVWRRLLVQNVVTGCATILNRALCAAAIPIPARAIMHDWWLALVAACLGKIVHVPWASTLYRQHGGNDTGARRWSVSYVFDRVRRLSKDDSLVRTQRQAAALAERMRGHLDESCWRVIEAYGRLGQESWMARRVFVVQHGLWKIGFVRNIGMLIRM